MACKSSTQWEIENCNGEGILDAVLDGFQEQVQAGLGIGWTVDITVGAEAANVILVEVEVFDAEGEPLEEVKHLTAWLSDAAGGAPTAVAPDADVAINGGIGAILLEHTTDIFFEFLTDANGELDLDIGDTGSPTFYLNVITAEGAIVSSTAITFA